MVPVWVYFSRLSMSIMEGRLTFWLARHTVRSAGWHLELAVGGQGHDEDFTASQWTPAYGRLEKTQAYNLSLGPSTHDQLVAVTSTLRASVTHR